MNHQQGNNSYENILRQNTQNIHINQKNPNNQNINNENINIQQGSVFRETQCDVTNCCGNDNGSTNPLCQALKIGNMANSQPLSCILNLMENNPQLSKSQIEAGYKAFVDVTGYKPYENNNDVVIQQEMVQKQMSYITSFYIYFPICIILLIAIWILVGYNVFPWTVGIILSIFLILIIFIFSAIYTYQFEQLILHNKSITQEEMQNIKEQYQQSIALWPQAMFSVICAITNTPP